MTFIARTTADVFQSPSPPKPKPAAIMRCEPTPGSWGQTVQILERVRVTDEIAVGQKGFQAQLIRAASRIDLWRLPPFLRSADIS